MFNTPSPILAQHHQHPHSTSPSFYQQQHSSALPNDDIYAETDEEDYPDDDVEDDEVVEEHWECNMCTFRNHPQLNICEACDNVRILPGTLPNLSKAISNSSVAIAAATAAAAVASPTAVGLLTAASPSLNVDGAVGSGTTVANNVTANGNLEHDTNLAQQQLQHFALHT